MMAPGQLPKYGDLLIKPPAPSAHIYRFSLNCYLLSFAFEDDTTSNAPQLGEQVSLIRPVGPSSLPTLQTYGVSFLFQSCGCHSQSCLRGTQFLDLWIGSLRGISFHPTMCKSLSKPHKYFSIQHSSVGLSVIMWEIYSSFIHINAVYVMGSINVHPHSAVFKATQHIQKFFIEGQRMSKDNYRIH